MAIYKNKTGQKLAVFAVDSTGAAKTGDAANITAYLSKDGGAVAATNDANPTELDATNAKGVYLFDLTQAESNADMLVVAPKSTTSGVTLRPVIVYTEPEMRSADVTNWKGATAPAMTGDAYARLGAPAGASIAADIATRSTLTAQQVWEYATRSLTTFGTLVADIWAAATSALTAAGSIGKRLADNIDATISSRSTYAGGDTAGTTTLLSRLSSGRATNLDNLDATVSSRLASSGYTAPDNSGIAASKVAAESVDAKLTTARAGKLDNLDAQVSTRLATTAYTAPDNSGIASAAASAASAASNASLAKTAADSAASAASLAAGNASDAATAAGAVSTKLAGLTEDVGGDRFTSHALSEAPAGAGSDPEVIAEAVDAKLSTTHGAGSWLSVGGVGEGTITYSYGPLTNLTTGQPIDDALVEVSTNEAMTNIIQTARTNAFGMATLVFDSAGQYWFRPSKSGFAAMAPEMVEITA